MEVEDDTQCVAEGCENLATKQRIVIMPSLSSFNKEAPPIELHVPVCQLHYEILEEHK